VTALVSQVAENSFAFDSGDCLDIGVGDTATINLVDAPFNVEDGIEESDDEDDFENIQHDKYVDLKKKIRMECVYDRKFRRWTPLKIAHKYAKVVHINKL